MSKNFNPWLFFVVLPLILGACATQHVPTKLTSTTHKSRYPFVVKSPDSMSMPAVPSSGLRTVDDVLYDFGPYAVQQFKPYFQKAGVSYPPGEVLFVAFKEERKLELWARNHDVTRYQWIRDYEIKAASGKPGPKLRQGDRQVPEGIYQIIGLNPNSNYHLSLKLNYPNEFDLWHAHQEGRFDPGSEIFIHGKDVSAGCLAMGDLAVEELFVMAAQVGKENMKVIIAPHDPRIRSLEPNSRDLPIWTRDLYEGIAREILPLQKSLRVSHQ
jgi:hypothetical protein